jgi:hypothetical protein
LLLSLSIVLVVSSAVVADTLRILRRFPSSSRASVQQTAQQRCTRPCPSHSCPVKVRFPSHIAHRHHSPVCRSSRRLRNALTRHALPQSRQPQLLSHLRSSRASLHSLQPSALPLSYHCRPAPCCHLHLYCQQQIPATITSLRQTLDSSSSSLPALSVSFRCVRQSSPTASASPSFSPLPLPSPPFPLPVVLPSVPVCAVRCCDHLLLR